LRVLAFFGHSDQSLSLLMEYLDEVEDPQGALAEFVAQGHRPAGAETT